MQKRQRPKSRKKKFPGGLQPPGNCLPVSVALREHGLHENAVALLGAVDQHVCVLMIPTKPLNFRKPRIEVNYDFAIGSLIVVNLFKNDL